MPELTPQPIGPADEATTLGRYTLLARIGQGGMAEIFLARQAGPRGFERLCALKTMKEMSAGADEHDEMFLDEARIAAQLSHPNIVQIYDFGEEEGRLFIAMEYLAGETLGAVLRRASQEGAAFPHAFAAYVVSAAAAGLAYAHGYTDITGRSLNIVHRDISPDNLFVTYDGAVKVLDFGIAKAAHRSAHTAAGLVKGKIGYMAPEQLQGRELDGRTDVFALGMVLFEALCGHPFERKTQPALEYLTGRAEAPPPHLLNPEVAPALEEIILGAIAVDRDERVHSAAELQRMLEAWLRTQEGVTPAALGAWMREAFAARREERSRLLEQVLAAPGTAPKLAAAPAEAEQAVDTRTDVPEQAPAALQAISPPLGGGAPEPGVGQAASALLPELAPAGDVTSVGGAPQPPGEAVAAPGDATVVARPPRGDSTLVERAPQPPGPEGRPPETSLTDEEILRATSRPRWPMVGAVAAVLLLVGGGAFLLSRSSGGPSPSPSPAPPIAQAQPAKPLPLPRAAGPEVAVAEPASAVAKPEPVKPSPSPAPTSPAQPVPAPEVQAAAAPVPSPAPPPTPPPEHRPEPRHRVRREPGKLTLDTVPWSTVYEGSTKLGDTPLFQVALPAGAHALRLVNGPAKLEKRVVVTIRSGQVTAKRIELK